MNGTVSHFSLIRTSLTAQGLVLFLFYPCGIVLRMNRCAFIAALILSLMAYSACAGEVYQVKVIGISDGGTVTVLRGGGIRGETIKLPKIKQNKLQM